MIEIRYLQAESGANRFGTCNCCGKSSGEDPLMISIKFSYYGHGTLICLCDDCKKKLTEALPPANNSEIPNSSDTISRAKAIDIAQKLIVTLDGYEMHNQAVANYCVEITQLPPAQPKTGKWALQSDDYHEYYECDQCGMAVGLDDVRNFCPNCGADMREEKEK